MPLDDAARLAQRTGPQRKGCFAAMNWVSTAGLQSSMNAPGEGTRPTAPWLLIQERVLGSWERLCKVGVPDAEYVTVPRRIPPGKRPRGYVGRAEVHGCWRACPTAVFSCGFPAFNAKVTFHQKALVPPTYGVSVALCPQGIGLLAQPNRKESTRQQGVLKDIEDDAIRMLTPLVKYRRAPQCCCTLHVPPLNPPSGPAADVTGPPGSERCFHS